MDTRAHKLEVMLNRLLNKVNLVTCAWRHRGVVVDGAMNQLVERQNQIEKELRELPTVQPETEEK